MLRVCVIGMGPIGNLHSRVYQADPLAELVGVCDRNPQLMNIAMQKFHVQGYTDAARMLDAQKPDIVSVTTGGYEYGSDHFEPTMQALDAGCHVLGEKPGPRAATSPPRSPPHRVAHGPADPPACRTS